MSVPSRILDLLWLHSWKKVPAKYSYQIGDLVMMHLMVIPQ